MSRVCATRRSGPAGPSPPTGEAMRLNVSGRMAPTVVTWPRIPMTRRSAARLPCSTCWTGAGRWSACIASLGFCGQWPQLAGRSRGRAASVRAGFVPVFLDPPLDISINDDLRAGHPARGGRTALHRDRVRRLAGEDCQPSPHDVHHGHETVGRGEQRAMATLPESVRWWMCGVWGDLPVSATSSTPSISGRSTAPCTSSEAYAGELDRNDYRRLLTGRAMANRVLGSEAGLRLRRGAATWTLPYAEVLTEGQAARRPLHGVGAPPARRGAVGRHHSLRHRPGRGGSSRPACTS